MRDDLPTSDWMMTQSPLAPVPASAPAPSPVAAGELSLTTIRAEGGGQRYMQSLRDLWEYRELFHAFLVRDLKVRYKQTALGVAWVVLQPLIGGLLFAAVMGLIRGRFGGPEDLLFFMAALVPWTSFQGGVTMAAASLETNANMITKVYFPRLAVPAAYVTGSVVDFAIGFGTLVILAVALGVFSPWLLAVVPVLLLIQVATALGVAFFLSSLNAQYRDVKFAVPFVLQLGMFVTVWIPLTEWRSGALAGAPAAGSLGAMAAELLAWNPMAAVAEGYRAAVAGGPPEAGLLLRGGAVAAVLLVLGTRFFLKRERRLADIL